MQNTDKTKSWSRRSFVSLLAGIPFTSAFRSTANFPPTHTLPNTSGIPHPHTFPATSPFPHSAVFPAKDEFDIKGTYINAAYTHPMSKGSFRAAQQFLGSRMLNRQAPKDYDGFDRTKALNNFAKLINASPEEIAWVPSTMFGENMIVYGLSLPGSNNNVVTDAFHFHGSLHLYNQLQKSGPSLTVVRPRNNRIELSDIDAAIRPNTKLLALSLVSATTGFQHDLKKVCELAHSRGTLVYADIIQAAGAVPIDVKSTGVDFCASSTYKWLMGDFGIGFLYVRADRLPLLKRTFIGFRQYSTFQSHFLPYDPPGKDLFESSSLENMSGHFEVGTFANEGINALDYSLEYLNKVDVAAIQQYKQPMINRLLTGLSGNSKYTLLTPVDSTSPIVCYAFKDAANTLKPKLTAADINISLYDNMIRISPSFYNDMDDIEKLIDVLKNA